MRLGPSRAKSGLMQYSNLASGDPDALSGEVARWRHVGQHVGEMG
jgi:hypothetical protein